MERLAQEHPAIGFYLSGHPLDDYAGGAAPRAGADACRAGAAGRAARSATIARIAGTIAAVDIRKSARGNRFAFVRLSDPTGLFEARMFSDVLDAARDHLEPGRSVVLTVEATLEGDELKLLARAAQPIDVAVAGAASAGLRIFIDDADGGAVAGGAARARWRATSRSRRKGPVNLVLMHPELPGEVEIALPEPYPMTPAGARARSRPWRASSISRNSEAAPGGRGGGSSGCCSTPIAELVPLGLAVALSPLPVIAVTLLAVARRRGRGRGWRSAPAGWPGWRWRRRRCSSWRWRLGALSLDLHAWSEIVIGTALLVAAAWKWVTRPRRGTVPRAAALGRLAGAGRDGARAGARAGASAGSIRRTWRWR